MEGNAPPAPGAELEPGADGTPAAAPPATAEPVAPPDPEPSADQSAAEPDSRIAQAEYTRSQQTIAAIRQELGLDRKATREQVLEALRARTAAPSPDDDSEPAPPPDPRYAELEERARTAEFRVQEAIYSPILGAGITTRVIDLANTLRTTDDPEELMGAVAAFIEDSRPKAAAPSDQPVPGAAAPAAPPDIGLPEGDQGPSARPSPTAGRRESGVVTAVRGLFRDAAEAATTRR